MGFALVKFGDVCVQLTGIKETASEPDVEEAFEPDYDSYCSRNPHWGF
jgi:hypothetical protein